MKRFSSSWNRPRPEVDEDVISVRQDSTRRLLAGLAALATGTALLAWHAPFATAGNDWIAQTLSGPSAVEPADTTVEYESNPLGIDIERPRLSWTLTSNEPTPLSLRYRATTLPATDDVGEQGR